MTDQTRVDAFTKAEALVNKVREQVQKDYAGRSRPDTTTERVQAILSVAAFITDPR